MSARPVSGPTAHPKPGTVRDRLGRPCPRATADLYPLSANCTTCHAGISCADGQADWVHVGSRQGQCPQTWREQGFYPTKGPNQAWSR